MASGSSKTTYHHGNVREAALAAALERVKRNGLKGLSLRAIASDIDVTHGALYQHFGSRAELMDAIGAAGFHALADALDAAADRGSFVASYIRFALENPYLYDIAMTRNHADVQDSQLLQHAVQRVISTAIRSVNRQGKKRPATKIEVMRLWTILHGALTLHSNGILEPRNEEQLTRLVLELADPGNQAPNSQSSS